MSFFFLARAYLPERKRRPDPFDSTAFLPIRQTFDSFTWEPRNSSWWLPFILPRTSLRPECQVGGFVASMPPRYFSTTSHLFSPDAIARLTYVPAGGSYLTELNYTSCSSRERSAGTNCSSIAAYPLSYTLEPSLRGIPGIFQGALTVHKSWMKKNVAALASASILLGSRCYRLINNRGCQSSSRPFRKPRLSGCTARRNN